MTNIIERLPFVRVIKNCGLPYLTRITLFSSKRFTLFLHLFHSPDPSRHQHNHPWNLCWAMCIWGGYTERVGPLMNSPLEQRYAMMARRFPGTLYHSIVALTRVPTITLFAHGERVRKWGFWVDGKNVPWDVYLEENGINTAEELDAVRERHGDD